MNTFELTETLVDDILFSMEDQEGDFSMDTQKVVIVRSAELKDDHSRYITIPEWNSSDGFRLMERFNAGIRNPLPREELSAALNRGRGVFRAFKNVLNSYPAIEKRWFAFKEREMKREIFRWYNALRDEWGLERIGLEPEETDELVLEDFIFRPAQEHDLSAVEELHRACLDEYPACSKRYQEEGRAAFIAETGSGDFAAYIAAAHDDAVFVITALEVKAEYRGLGIGEELLSRFIEKLDPQSPTAVVSMNLPAEAEGFSRVLLRNNFTPFATHYCVTLRKP
ncbi:MAG: GNAT family N-acetyltransferase [Treponema sp.]|jgi:GNAT superfamily N-acetyltransferase|nr:GNAT family N-acetyltransferase [Treponema sp.]